MLSTLRQRIKLSSTSIGIVVSIPILATAQGAYLLTKFRSNHKDAPYPKSPCQGIVIVSPQDSMSDNADNYDHRSKQKFKNDNFFHQKWLTLWKRSQIVNTNNLFRKEKLQKQSPLRIFVVGDSLAAGVGSTSGTPVLPEAIAKSLSKALGGRPVHWTCHGTPGASTSRIMKDIEEITHVDYQLVLSEKKKSIHFQKIKDRVKNILERRETVSKERNESSNTSAPDNVNFKQIMKRLGNLIKQSTKEDHEVQQWNQWSSELLRATSPKRKDAAQYDFVIVLTGLNDLKSIFLPFLQDEDGTNGVSFKEELRNVFHFLIGKKHDSSEDESTSNERVPLPVIVLPALPTRVLPMLQYPPLGWVIHMLCDLIDEQKRALSEEYPGNLLFIEAPTIQMIDEIEKGQYFLCAKEKAERVLLRIQNVTLRVRKELECLMHKHVQYHDFKDNAKEIELNYEASRDNSLADSMPDSIGSKLVSVDNIHPNNLGYEFWGRHIAEGIIKEMKLGKNEVKG